MRVSGNGEKSAPPGGHLAYLDGLRAVAALCVVIHHLQQMFLFEEHTPLYLEWPLKLFRPWGHFAVSIFIVVSGFSLMLPVVRASYSLAGGALGFYKKRARRILPPYYCAIAFALLLPLFVPQVPRGPLTRAGLLSHLFLVHNFSSQTINQINAVFWSIAVESQLYLFFPLLVALWRRVGGLVTTAGAIALGYIGLKLVRATELEGLTPHYLALFALGMLTAALSFDQSPLWLSLRKKIPWKVLTGALALITTVPCYFEEMLPLRTFDFLVGFFALALLVTASQADGGWPRAALSWKPLAAIGTYSYSIYLVHLPLLHVIIFSMHFPLQFPNAAFLAFLLGGVALCLLGSYAFYCVCERPFLRRREPSLISRTTS